MTVVASPKTQRAPRQVSLREWQSYLDRRARRLLGMSGEEFITKWQAGKFEKSDDPNVMRVAMLLPLGRTDP